MGFSSIIIQILVTSAFLAFSAVWLIPNLQLLGLGHEPTFQDLFVTNMIVIGSAVILSWIIIKRLGYENQ